MKHSRFIWTERVRASYQGASLLAMGLMALFLGSNPAKAATFTVNCSGTITSALQSAVNSAANGDTVNISAGNCSGGTVSWQNKNIRVMGQGMGSTTVTGLNFNVRTTTAANFRISGMNVGCPGTPWKVDGYNRTTGIKGWRIDNISFNCGGCTQNIAINVLGITWGLIDHIAASGMGNAIFMQSWAEATNEVNPWPPNADPGMGGYAWMLPYNLGSDEAVYIEDSSFSMPNGCYFGIGDMYYGARMVFRHNKVNNAYWQNHAARSHERGGNAKAEIYNNDFNATDTAWYRAIHMRSGSGVIFNNTIRGPFTTIQVDNQRSNGQNSSTPFASCNGSRSWDGNDGAANAPGWPCLDQIGTIPGAKFPNQLRDPVYVWNNGSALGCSTGGSCTVNRTLIGDGDPYVVSGRDFINSSTPKPGYTPFTYPHPLQSGGSGPVSLVPPTGLTAAIQ